MPVWNGAFLNIDYVSKTRPIEIDQKRNFIKYKLFDWNPDFPYFLGIILMIFCLIISILDKRLNIKVDFDEDIGHSGHTG